MRIAGGEGKVRDALDPQLVPDGSKVVTLVKLDFIGDLAGAELFVGRVLKVPASLRLLDVFAEGLLLSSLDALLDGAPHLEVLGGIAVLVLSGALPGDEEGAAGGETELVDVDDGQRQDVLAIGGVDDGDEFGCGPSKVAATGGVFTTPEVPFGLGEPSKRLVDGRGIGDTDVLLGAEGKLQRGRHD